MAMGSVRDIVVKLVDLDKRLRTLDKKITSLEDRIGVVETNSISYHNRLEQLEEQDDDD